MRLLNVALLLFLAACNSSQKKVENMYQVQCASCHIAPDIQDLPKHVWKTTVLPEMAARMGIKDSTYNPYKGFKFSEQESMMKTNIYNVRAAISKKDWKLLKEYIIATAPDSLWSMPSKKITKSLSQFTTRTVNVDSVKGSFITYLAINEEKAAIITADMAGNIRTYDTQKNEVVQKGNFHGAVTSYLEKDNTKIVTMVGRLNPSEQARGKVFQLSKGEMDTVAINLHRPVHNEVYDLNNNGSNEFLISEFGNLTGELSLWYKRGSSKYNKKTLLGLPGIVRSIARDMNGDGKMDIVALSSQGNESITILYQKNDLEFDAEQVIRFSPVYGSSWFELLDYNGDGYDDIITVHGDNADKSYVHKPYHGLRIYLNDGKNQFKEHFFYPLNGATNFVAHDFDKDGDIDFGIVSPFPNYQKSPELSFVYLENTNTDTFTFESYTTDVSSLGRWLLIAAKDIDKDGDSDIVLSSFTYSFTPVPKEVSSIWRESDVDLLILENTLYQN